MSNNETPKVEAPANSVQAPVETNSTPSAPINKPLLDMDELKGFMRATIKELFNEAKFDESRKEIESLNDKIVEATQTSQAQLIKPKLQTNEQPLKYVKRVLEEDHNTRMKSSEGKAYYAPEGEDFLKFKIKLLQHIGQTEEEIAETIKDLF